MKSAEVKQKLAAMDEAAARFNLHLLSVPRILIASGKLEGTPLSHTIEVESSMGRLMRLDSHKILTTIAKMGILDKHHDQIIGRDEQFFLAINGQAKLREWKSTDSNVLSRNADYYGEIIAAIQGAWPSLDGVTREKVWFHIGAFYEAYLSYDPEI
jgi:hypothetical protein